MKMLSPVHSATSPLWLSISASRQPAADRFDLGQDVVEIVQRFDARRQCGRVIADRRRRDDLHARSRTVPADTGDVVDDDDDLRLAVARIEAQCAGAARDEQADVAVVFSLVRTTSSTAWVISSRLIGISSAIERALS